MKEKSIFWTISIFLCWYILFLVLVGILFAVTGFDETDVTSTIAFVLSALTLSHYLFKKSAVPDAKINKISLYLAITVLLTPFVIGAVFSVFGFLFGANLPAHIFSAWQQAGVLALITQIEQQGFAALIVFAVMKYSLEGRLFWKKRQSV